MGSLPDLTERSRSELKPAARTYSDPNKNKIKVRPSVATVEWNRGGKTQQYPGSVLHPAKRKDSCSSSVGAASVKKLINRAPIRRSSTAFRGFTMLCFSHVLSSAALLPLTVIIGTQDGSFHLALMHLVAAVVSPFSHLILLRAKIFEVVCAAYFLLVILFIASAVGTPLLPLTPVYAMAGLGLGPLAVASTSAATAAACSLTIGARDEEVRRRVLLRRFLRSIRASQDLGLLLGSLLLGFGVTYWPSDRSGLAYNNTIVVENSSLLENQWPPPESYPAEDTSEEDICGANGCPHSSIQDGSALNSEGIILLNITWSILSILALAFGVMGSRGLPPSPAADLMPAPPCHKETRALFAIPVGLFIGLQNGFIFTSYVKWYSVCVGGWQIAWITLVGVATLQSLAAATLSMAAARGMRRALTAGGAAAHACLVLALLRWRAARNDVALPSVAAAAWGACGALWDVMQTSAGVGSSGWRRSWSSVTAARHVGFALALAARGSICVMFQLMTLVVVLLFAVGSQWYLEARLKKINAPRVSSNGTSGSGGMLRTEPI